MGMSAAEAKMTVGIRGAERVSCCPLGLDRTIGRHISAEPPDPETHLLEVRP